MILVGELFGVDASPVDEDAYAGTEVGARPLAMGKAFVAVADDGNAIYWNPAGLTQMNVNVATTVILTDRKGIEDIMRNTFKAIGKPLAFIGLASSRGGYSWRPLADFHADNIYTKQTDDNGNTVEEWKDKRYKISEYTFALAKKSGGEYSKFALGIGIKYLRGSLGMAKVRKVNDVYEAPEISLSNGRGFGIDLGTLLTLSDRVNLACVIHNLWTRMRWDDYPTDKAKANIRAGFALRTSESLTLAADVERKFSKDAPNIYHIGAEQLIFSIVFIRAGLYGENLKNPQKRIYTAGLGYSKGNYHIDLAVLWKYKREVSDVSYLCSISAFF